MENKVESVMNGAMERIKNLVDVDTVIGDPIKVNEDVTIIPISKVTCGFASGGSGFGANPQNEHFGGGAGGCVKVMPLGFIVIKGENVRMLPIAESMNGVDKLIDLIPEVFDKVTALFKKDEEY
jgi:sporulation protein YtfJ